MSCKDISQQIIDLCTFLEQRMTKISELTKEEFALWLNDIAPITRASIYPNGTTVNHRHKYGTWNNEKSTKGKRGKVMRQSGRSLNNLVFLVAETKYKFASMLTLTYGNSYPKNGMESKGHLNTFLTSLRRQFPGCAYVWWLEWQRRGAPHYHILLNFSPNSLRTRYGVAMLWLDCVGRYANDKMLKVHCHNDTWEQMKKPHAPQAYLVKEAAKRYQKKPPKDFSSVGRTWGASKSIKNNMGEPVSIAMSEQQLRDIFPEFEHWSIFPKIVYPRGDK